MLLLLLHCWGMHLEPPLLHSVTGPFCSLPLLTLRNVCAGHSLACGCRIPAWCQLSCKAVHAHPPPGRFSARVQGAEQPFYITADEGEEFTLDQPHFCRAIATGGCCLVVAVVAAKWVGC